MPKTVASLQWDPYAVWRTLLSRHAVRDSDPAGSCGHIDRTTLAEFCEAIADYPDFLQDALLVIAHAKGIEAAAAALDDAVREELASRIEPSRSAPPATIRQTAGPLPKSPAR